MNSTDLLEKSSVHTIQTVSSIPGSILELSRTRPSLCGRVFSSGDSALVFSDRIFLWSSDSHVAKLTRSLVNYVSNPEFLVLLGNHTFVIASEEGQFECWHFRESNQWTSFVFTLPSLKSDLICSVTPFLVLNGFVVGTENGSIFLVRSHSNFANREDIEIVELSQHKDKISNFASQPPFSAPSASGLWNLTKFMGLNKATVDSSLLSVKSLLPIVVSDKRNIGLLASFGSGFAMYSFSFDANKKLQFGLVFTHAFPEPFSRLSTSSSELLSHLHLAASSSGDLFVLSKVTPSDSATSSSRLTLSVFPFASLLSAGNSSSSSTLPLSHFASFSLSSSEDTFLQHLRVFPAASTSSSILRALIAPSSLASKASVFQFDWREGSPAQLRKFLIQIPIASFAAISSSSHLSALIPSISASSPSSFVLALSPSVGLVAISLFSPTQGDLDMSSSSSTTTTTTTTASKTTVPSQSSSLSSSSSLTDSLLASSVTLLNSSLKLLLPLVQTQSAARASAASTASSLFFQPMRLLSGDLQALATLSSSQYTSPSLDAQALLPLVDVGFHSSPATASPSTSSLMFFPGFGQITEIVQAIKQQQPLKTSNFSNLSQFSVFDFACLCSAALLCFSPHPAYAPNASLPLPKQLEERTNRLYALLDVLSVSLSSQQQSSHQPQRILLFSLLSSQAQQMLLSLSGLFFAFRTFVLLLTQQQTPLISTTTTTSLTTEQQQQLFAEEEPQLFEARKQLFAVAVERALQHKQQQPATTQQQQTQQIHPLVDQLQQEESTSSRLLLLLRSCPSSVALCVTSGRPTLLLLLNQIINTLQQQLQGTQQQQQQQQQQDHLLKLNAFASLLLSLLQRATEFHQQTPFTTTTTSTTAATSLLLPFYLTSPFLHLALKFFVLSCATLQQQQSGRWQQSLFTRLLLLCRLLLTSLKQQAQAFQSSALFLDFKKDVVALRSFLLQQLHITALALQQQQQQKEEEHKMVLLAEQRDQQLESSSAPSNFFKSPIYSVLQLAEEFKDFLFVCLLLDLWNRAELERKLHASSNAESSPSPVEAFVTPFFAPEVEEFLQHLLDKHQRAFAMALFRFYLASSPASSSASSSSSSSLMDSSESDLVPFSEKFMSCCGRLHVLFQFATSNSQFNEWLNEFLSELPQQQAQYIQWMVELQQGNLLNVASLVTAFSAIANQAKHSQFSHFETTAFLSVAKICLYVLSQQAQSTPATLLGSVQHHLDLCATQIFVQDGAISKTQPLQDAPILLKRLIDLVTSFVIDEEEEEEVEEQQSFAFMIDEQQLTSEALEMKKEEEKEWRQLERQRAREDRRTKASAGFSAAAKILVDSCKDSKERERLMLELWVAAIVADGPGWLRLAENQQAFGLHPSQVAWTQVFLLARELAMREFYGHAAAFRSTCGQAIHEAFLKLSKMFDSIDASMISAMTGAMKQAAFFGFEPNSN